MNQRQKPRDMREQIPIKQCHYCGSNDLGSGWQQDQGLVTYKRSGLFGNPVRHIICRRCGGILYSKVLNAHKYPNIQRYKNEAYN